MYYVQKITKVIELNLTAGIRIESLNLRTSLL